MFSAPTRVAVLLAALAAACTPEDGPQMRPGEDCMQCHGGAGDGEEEGPRWTIAGTAYFDLNAPASAGIQDAHVQVTDRNGQFLSLRTNGAGNFYSAEPVAFPISVCVERGGVSPVCMQAKADSGSCNACHTPSGEAGGRVAVP